MLRLGRFISAGGEAIDEVTAVYMPEGRSYTGLEQVEIFCHGGRQVVRRILRELLATGARAAEPGEFTKLAFLNGRIDLSRAEAVAELVAANTETSYRASREHLLGAYSKKIGQLREQIISVLGDIETGIDFSEEEVPPVLPEHLVDTLAELRANIEELLGTYRGGRIVSEGFRIVIGGRSNVGKSSLFNLLLQQERALVTAAAGTTRDYLSEWIDIEGVAVNLVDTAGLRGEAEEVERMGQERAREMMGKADLLLWLVDLSEGDWPEQLGADLAELHFPRVVPVGNKVDLVVAPEQDETVLEQLGARISCLTGEGMEELRRRVQSLVTENIPDLTSGLVVTSARHQQKLSVARQAIRRVEALIEEKESAEILAFELQQAVRALDEITGKVYTEEILESIFSRFCIGK